MKLYINGLEVEYTKLSLDERIGEVSHLNGTITSSVELNDRVQLGTFKGFIVWYRESRSGLVDFIAYQDAYKLRGIVSPLDHYYGLPIENILVGRSDTPMTDITFEPHQSHVFIDYYNISSLYSFKDGDFNGIIVGYLKNSLIRESINITSSIDASGNDQDIAYSKYTEKPDGGEIVGAAWDKIISFHIEDKYSQFAHFTYGLDYIKLCNRPDSIATTLCQLDEYETFAALQDSKGYYANGFLYNTGLDYTLDIDSNYLNAGYYVDGSNALEIVQSLCTNPVSFGVKEFQPFQATFKLDGNNLIIKQSDIKVREILREDEEILGFEIEEDMREIANRLSFITKDDVVTREDDNSIRKYGTYETIEEVGLAKPQAWFLNNREADYYSMPEEKITIECNKHLNPGDKIDLKIDSLEIDKPMTVQAVMSEFGINANKYSVTLCEYIPRKIWYENLERRKEMQTLWDIFIKNRRKIFQRHKNTDLYSVIAGRRRICGSSKPFDFTITGSTYSDIGSHSHNFDSPSSLQDDCQHIFNRGMR